LAVKINGNGGWLLKPMEMVVGC